ncbi:hypothetical protein [Borreliella burgdorferi]|uniref:hypothetical protein n=1 Tax=Borreliella burgdorferi TaxID=139 RepID=UPI001E33E8FC|nr:hypothetical protein [Borreliella burgdorferi]MCD2386307.1 hypothetical protein [Borreliella burgdorferi]
MLIGILYYHYLKTLIKKDFRGLFLSFGILILYFCIIDLEFVGVLPYFLFISLESFILVFLVNGDKF